MKWFFALPFFWDSYRFVRVGLKRSPLELSEDPQGVFLYLFGVRGSVAPKTWVILLPFTFKGVCKLFRRASPLLLYIPWVIFVLFTALPYQCKLYYLLSYIISDITRKEASGDGEREASTGRGKKNKMEQHREWLLNFGFVPIFHFLVSRS